MLPDICICICTCICICNKEEMLLEVTRRAPSTPPLPVALQTTCFLDSLAFPEAPYFLRAPWINSLCWSIRFRYWSEFVLNVRPSMKVRNKFGICNFQFWLINVCSNIFLHKQLANDTLMDLSSFETGFWMVGCGPHPPQDEGQRWNLLCYDSTLMFC